MDRGRFGYNCVQMHPSGEFEVEPGSQRMTHEEANAVVQLWQRQQSQAEAVQSLPSLGDLAEALKIPEASVAELLEQVRAKQALERHRPEPMPASRRRSLMLAGFGAALFVVLLALVLSLTLTSTVSSEPAVSSGGVTTAVAPVPERAVNATAPEATFEEGSSRVKAVPKGEEF